MKDIAFTFIELPKYTKGKNEKLTSRIEQWCRYFKYGDNTTEEEVAKIIDPEIRSAYEAINRFNWTEEELGAYEASEKREMDYRAQMSAAKRIGLEEGKIEGREEGKIEGERIGVEKGKMEIAKKMLENGMSLELIAQLTDLTIDQITDLT